ncbi:MAG: ATP-binding cassette domain-containing protein [Lachnospiraceae bacterium]|nr:ATP-binding cassette domain-containing protein [Lachnospiraceae bacterium]
MEQSTFDLIMKLLNYFLFSAGLFKIFGKFKIKRIWAFIPVVRFYKLSECAERKDEALAAVLCTALSDIFGLLFIFANKYIKSEAILLGIVLLAFTFFVMEFIYHVKVYSGLCEVFGVKGVKWLLLWIFFETVAALVWGFGKKYLPVNRNTEKAAHLSGKTEKETGEGLVIDIDERTVGSIFKRKTLLKDIHLTIKPGRMVLLLGGSGAGKTTFVNAVTGYEKAKARIVLNGKDVYKHFDDMQHEIGMVPQRDTVRYNDTIYNTVNDNAMLRLSDDYNKEGVKGKVEEVLQAFGLTNYGTAIVGKQSGGQIKRISISMEYVADPYLFVLDEPDSGLDGILARSLMQKLHDISREGRIVIVITHTPDRVIDLFDDVIVLAKDANRTGRLAYYGPVEDARRFFEKDTLEGIISTINRKEEGGEGRADEMIEHFEEARNGEK